MPSQNVETFRAAHQAFNRRDLDTMLSLLADNFRYEDRARAMSFSGRAGFDQFLQGWITAFSDANVFEPTYIDGGDTVVALFRGRGTNDGALGPMPPSGRPLNLAFCEIMRFNAAGKIVSGELYYDQMTLLSQVGNPAEAASV